MYTNIEVLACSTSTGFMFLREVLAMTAIAQILRTFMPSLLLDFASEAKVAVYIFLEGIHVLTVLELSLITL